LLFYTIMLRKQHSLSFWNKQNANVSPVFIQQNASVHQ